MPNAHRVLARSNATTEVAMGHSLDSVYGVLSATFDLLNSERARTVIPRASRGAVNESRWRSDGALACGFSCWFFVLAS